MLPVSLVDAFVTASPFSGNPAGVLVTTEPLPEGTMASIAAELNQAETAFVVAATEGTSIRWFTPTVEVDLCGHATLAAAHVLFESDPGMDSVSFQSRSGVLSVSKRDGLLWLDFPLQPPVEADDPYLHFLVPGCIWAGSNGSDRVAVLPSEADIRSYRPDMAGIAKLGDRGLVITAETPRGYVSRFFAPQAGVPEDHATGSSHTLLAPLWSDRTGRTSFESVQASARGAEFSVRIESGRVHIGGKTVFRLQGEIAI